MTVRCEFEKLADALRRQETGLAILGKNRNKALENFWVKVLLTDHMLDNLMLVDEIKDPSLIIFVQLDLSLDNLL